MDMSPYWPMILDVAQQRLANNKTEQHVDRYGEGIEVQGAAGELAARLTLGLPPELHVNFDHGVDFYWAGRRVDVKTTKLTPKLHYRFLQWPEWKQVNCDFILLMAVDLEKREAIAVGYATNEDIQNAPLNVKRYVPCREIRTRDLYPIWYLMSRGYQLQLEEQGV